MIRLSIRLDNTAGFKKLMDMEVAQNNDDETQAD